MDDNPSRKILGSAPLYSQQQVLNLAAEAKVKFWTKDSGRNAESLSLDTDDVASLVIQAVQYGRYIGSEWCQQGSSNSVAACDAYAVLVSETIDGINTTSPYYLKFAIGKTGQILLMVSNHLEGM